MRPHQRQQQPRIALQRLQHQSPGGVAESSSTAVSQSPEASAATSDSAYASETSSEYTSEEVSETTYTPSNEPLFLSMPFGPTGRTESVLRAMSLVSGGCTEGPLSPWTEASIGLSTFSRGGTGRRGGVGNAHGGTNALPPAFLSAKGRKFPGQGTEAPQEPSSPLTRRNFTNAVTPAQWPPVSEIGTNVPGRTTAPPRPPNPMGDLHLPPIPDKPRPRTSGACVPPTTAGPFTHGPGSNTGRFALERHPGTRTVRPPTYPGDAGLTRVPEKAAIEGVAGRATAPSPLEFIPTKSEASAAPRGGAPFAPGGSDGGGGVEKDVRMLLGDAAKRRVGALRTEPAEKDGFGSAVRSASSVPSSWEGTVAAAVPPALGAGAGAKPPDGTAEVTTEAGSLEENVARVLAAAKRAAEGPRAALVVAQGVGLRVWDAPRPSTGRTAMVAKARARTGEVPCGDKRSEVVPANDAPHDIFSPLSPKAPGVGVLEKTQKFANEHHQKPPHQRQPQPLARCNVPRRLAEQRLLMEEKTQRRKFRILEATDRAVILNDIMEKQQSLNRHCTLRPGGEASGAQSPLRPPPQLNEKKSVAGSGTSEKPSRTVSRAPGGEARRSPLPHVLGAGLALARPIEGATFHSPKNAKAEKAVLHKPPGRRMKPTRRRAIKPLMELPPSNEVSLIELAEGDQRAANDGAESPNEAHRSSPSHGRSTFQNSEAGAAAIVHKPSFLDGEDAKNTAPVTCIASLDGERRCGSANSLNSSLYNLRQVPQPTHPLSPNPTGEMGEICRTSNISAAAASAGAGRDSKRRKVAGVGGVPRTGVLPSLKSAGRDIARRV
ncbi:uncharacterized protein Tco025E_00915 [Trypanosoma conorhini]|uniref:Uncharacterized protein n=1 Tax=Trypanosoma conorhini TaxID=83891 RepID=A0A3R7M586_9TRYP|nr:uncharacterized protein Tco025E_00915 [Trypanosoma conorhini]RNF26833.1 hypothetical protein Tco025E_00915 [Trypanosoma conorhini]